MKNLLILFLVLSLSPMALANESANLDAQLRQAVEENNITKVKSLLRKKANPNARNAEGWTPLHIAADRGHYQAARSLLSNIRINVNIKEHTKGYTALQIARNMGHQDIEEILIAHGAKE